MDLNSPIILDGIDIPIGQTLRGRPARPPLLDSRGGKRPAAVDTAKSREADPSDYAAAWLAQRFQVPAVLAETIATLAGLGGRSS